MAPGLAIRTLATGHADHAYRPAGGAMVNRRSRPAEQYRYDRYDPISAKRSTRQHPGHRRSARRRRSRTCKLY